MHAPVLDTLNPEQQAAVTHLAGPLWVNAIPGSGKTRVIVARCAWLISQGVRPEHILAITFSRRAAREITERLAQTVGPQARRIWAGTVHSFATWLLRLHAPLVGRSRSFAIWDEADQLRALRRIAHTLSLTLDPAELREGVELAKRASAPPRHQDVARALAAYTEALRAHDAFDFADLVIQAVALLERHPALTRALRRRLPHVLVDEAQDLDLWQHRLVELLAGAQAAPAPAPPPPEPGASLQTPAAPEPPGDLYDAPDPVTSSLMLAADIDQSIGGYRGSAPERLLAFERIYPGAAIVDIGHNYRSTPEILAAAERLIRHNRTHRHTRLLTSNPSGPAPEVWYFPRDAEETPAVARRIAAWVAAGQRPVGLLGRVGALLDPMARALTRLGLAVRLAGDTALTDRQEVRDLLAWLRAAVRPEDWAAHERALGVPPRGVGPASLERLRRDVVARGAAAALEHAARHHRGVRAYLALLDELRAHAAEPAAALRFLTDRLAFRAYLARRDPDQGDRRWAHVEALIEAAGQWQHQGGQDTAAWLDELVLAQEAAPTDEPADVECLTIHQSKGAEFPAVVVLGLEEGILPSAYCQTPDDLEEERRLCYVAMTRARVRLALSCAFERTLWGRPRQLVPSRFLREAGLAP